MFLDSITIKGHPSSSVKYDLKFILPLANDIHSTICVYPVYFVKFWSATYIYRPHDPCTNVAWKVKSKSFFLIIMNMSLICSNNKDTFSYNSLVQTDLVRLRLIILEKWKCLGYCIYCNWVLLNIVILWSLGLHY